MSKAILDADEILQHREMTPAQPANGLVLRAVDQVRQFLCGLHGHDALLHFGQGRISLQCTSCGFETPGWDVKEEPVMGHHVLRTSTTRSPAIRR